MASTDLLDLVRCCRRRDIDYNLDTEVYPRQNSDHSVELPLKPRKPARVFSPARTSDHRPVLEPNYRHISDQGSPYGCSPRGWQDDPSEDSPSKGLRRETSLVSGNSKGADSSHPGCRLFVATFLTVLGVSFAGLAVVLVRYHFSGALPDLSRIIPWATRSMDTGSAPFGQAGTTGKFHCISDYTTKETGWSKAKRSWCCKHAGRGCSSDAGQVEYDCEARFRNWQQAWSDDKKQWCCDHAQAGCQRTPGADKAASGLAFDCGDGLDNGGVDWSTEKKVWCCMNEPSRCPSGPPKGVPGVAQVPQSPGSSCDTSCSVDGQQATCKERLRYFAELQKGPEACRLAEAQVVRECPVCDSCAAEMKLCGRSQAPVLDESAVGKASTTQPFDCRAGYTHWKDTWSHAKQAWCCQNSGIDIPCPPSTGARHDSSSTSAAPQQSTSFLLPFDCLAGLETWKRNWSSRKKSWCCEHTRHGCDGPSSSAAAEHGDPAATEDEADHADGLTHDCTAGFSKWERDWSINKKAWCCQHKKRGCPPRMTSVPYNCNDGFSKWKEQWSAAKKVWCCRNSGKGCEEAIGAEKFDCVEGYANWEVDWPPDKKKFCCSRIDCRRIPTNLAH